MGILSQRFLAVQGNGCFPELVCTFDDEYSFCLDAYLCSYMRPLIKLETEAQAQAEARAIEMTQVKTKYDANKSTSKIIRTFQTA